MSETSLLVPSRRGFLTGLAACLAAPAIVKASALMPLRGTPIVCDWITLDEYSARILQPQIDAIAQEQADALLYGIGASKNSLLTMDMITREAVQLFTNNNAFVQSLNLQYDNAFALQGAKIGETLHIRLPADHTVSDA